MKIFGYFFIESWEFFLLQTVVIYERSIHIFLPCRAIIHAKRFGKSFYRKTPRLKTDASRFVSDFIHAKRFGKSFYSKTALQYLYRQKKRFASILSLGVLL